MKKRLFAGLLSLLMLWTMLPVSALAVEDGTVETRPAYFYVLEPEKKDDHVTIATADFDYVGWGTIDAPAPNDPEYSGEKYDILEKNWSFAPPTDGNLKIDQIYFDNKLYYYTPNDTFDSGTGPQFRIEWYRYSSASGYTDENDISHGTDLCWHIDGYPVFSENYAINFKVKMPGSDEFSLYSVDETPYIQYITKGENAIVGSVNKPEMQSKTDENGVTYAFDGWYIDKECTKKADENQGTLLSQLAGEDNQITFYGKYVPETKVYVYADARDLVKDPDSLKYLTDILGFELDHNFFFPLGVLSNAELAAATSDIKVTDDQQNAVKTAAKEKANFDCNDTYKVYLTRDNENSTDVTYTKTTQAVIGDWIAAYADGELTGTLSAPMDTKEFGIPKDEGKYNWHLDIKLTDNILPTVTVTPADITIYTGGEGYGGVTNSNGTIIPGTEASGLPEPGYHIELPEVVQAWLEKNNTVALSDDAATTGAERLDGILTFTYDANGEQRTWSLKYQGVYDTDKDTDEPTRYVYSLEPANDEQDDVRLQFKDGNETLITSDDFEMAADTVSETYEMSIYPGALDQSQVKAQFTVNDKPFNCNVEVGTGKLTVKSVTDQDTMTSEILTSAPSDNTATITAVDNNSVTYYVNDSEVEVTNESNRVQLLVDEVSNDPNFNEAMGDDAIDKVRGDKNISLAQQGYEAKYLDLVDTENGNAVVTASDSLTIYWPVPEDAQDANDFYVVHYSGMNRENTVAVDDFDDYAQPVTTDTATIDGQKYVTFEASSFSPFVLVWGEATTPDPDPEPDPDPDPNPDPDPHPGGSTTTYYTLTYESNGGTEYDDERYPRNKVVELDKVPTREGYTFTGWYADEELTDRITEIKMTSDKTVYAGWEATGVPDWLNGDDHFAYVIGYPDGMVKPQNNISRAEVATIFFRLLKPEIRDKYLTQTNQFTDVSGSAWYNTAVSTMAALDIVKGRTPTTFVPDAPITRAEFAAVCARFDTHLRDGDSDFSDISGHWAEAEIERAATLGWINGYPDGTFRPDNAITRAEAMTMINRVLQRLPEDEDDLLPDMNVWPDNQPQDWYYLAVQEATNSHDFDRKHDGMHEHWTDMNADPNWTQYQ